jgi:rhodanese-related sulfurtransferase
VRLFTHAKSVDPRDVAERLAHRAVQVIDVRGPAEWRTGHIRGSHNLPLTDLRSRLQQIPKDKTIVAVCASGHRSAVAVRTLVRAGYEAENLRGGMRAWARAGLPTVNEIAPRVHGRRPPRRR